MSLSFVPFSIDLGGIIKKKIITVCSLFVYLYRYIAANSKRTGQVKTIQEKDLPMKKDKLEAIVSWI